MAIPKILPKTPLIRDEGHELSRTLKRNEDPHTERSKMNRRADILATLEKEGPLDAAQISARGNIPLGTVRAYLPPMRWAGLIKTHKNMKGIFEITEKGREYLKKGELE